MYGLVLSWPIETSPTTWMLYVGFTCRILDPYNLVRTLEEHHGRLKRTSRFVVVVCTLLWEGLSFS